MSKRLQVVLGDEELERYSRSAEVAGVTLSEWARQALRRAERQKSSGDVPAKLAVIRKAASYSFPVPDIDRLTAEIEAGRLAEIEAGMPGAGDV